MEDHVRTVPLEHFDYPRAALDVGEDGRRPLEPVLGAKRSGKSDERCLGVIEEDERVHAEPAELPGKLDADRSSGAGDQNGRAGEIVAEPLDVDRDSRPAEQRFDRIIVGRRSPVPRSRMRPPADDAVYRTRAGVSTRVKRMRSWRPWP
jgi:hypothetical protein